MLQCFSSVFNSSKHPFAYHLKKDKSIALNNRAFESFFSTDIPIITPIYKYFKKFLNKCVMEYFKKCTNKILQKVLYLVIAGQTQTFGHIKLVVGAGRSKKLGE